MKKIIVSAVALIFATAVNAGTVVYTAPEVAMIEEPARMGNSGAWLIPLIIAAILLLAISGTGGNGNGNGQINGQQ